MRPLLGGVAVRRSDALTRTLDASSAWARPFASISGRFTMDLDGYAAALDELRR